MNHHNKKSHHNSSASSSKWSTMARKRSTRLTLLFFLFLSLIAFGVFVPVFALLPTLSQSHNDQRHHPRTKRVSLYLFVTLQIHWKWKFGENLVLGFDFWVSLSLFQIICLSQQVKLLVQ